MTGSALVGDSARQINSASIPHYGSVAQLLEASGIKPDQVKEWILSEPPFPNILLTLRTQGGEVKDRSFLGSSIPFGKQCRCSLKYRVLAQFSQEMKVQSLLTAPYVR